MQMCILLYYWANNDDGFFVMASLNFVTQSTMYICHPLKSVDTSRNDSQSQKLEGDQIHLVPKFSKVGVDGSLRAVAPVASRDAQVHVLVLGIVNVDLLCSLFHELPSFARLCRNSE